MLVSVFQVQDVKRLLDEVMAVPAGAAGITSGPAGGRWSLCASGWAPPEGFAPMAAAIAEHVARPVAAADTSGAGFTEIFRLLDIALLHYALGLVWRTYQAIHRHRLR